MCPLGSPLAALTYVVNHLHSRGLGVEAGQVVIAGALCKFKQLAAGQALGVACLSADCMTYWAQAAGCGWAIFSQFCPTRWQELAVEMGVLGKVAATIAE